MNKLWKFCIPLLLIMIVVLCGLALLRRAYVYNFADDKKLAQTSGSDKSLADYLKTAQDLAAQNNQPTTATATFLAVGDIMLSRNVAAVIQKSGDVDLPFKNMAGILTSTDFNFGNLESPFTTGAPIIGGHSLIFGAWSGHVQDLSDFKFQVLNLANNHAFDQGLKGLDYTRTQLDSFGIKHEGTGDNLDEAWQPATVEANGIKICFVGASYASVNDGGKTTNNYVARIEDLTRLKSAIRNSQSSCDFTVVTMHAGTEYTRAANASQIAFAHAAIDDGADIVIGAHPHWVQNIEKYQGKYIFYSLGNFIFDQEWSQETKEGLTLKIQVSKNPAYAEAPAGGQEPALQGPHVAAKLDSIQLIPVIVENYSTPRPATGEESKKILEKIGQTDNLLYP